MFYTGNLRRLRAEEARTPSFVSPWQGTHVFVVVASDSIFCLVSCNVCARTHVGICRCRERGRQCSSLQSPGQDESDLEALIARWIRPGTVVICGPRVRIVSAWGAEDGSGAYANCCTISAPFTVRNRGDIVLCKRAELGSSSC
uniref:Uncharacterized protein n=1 Tax=Ascaris lumbricoides TaxID=6252 RepID=A0A0M3I409_ASCLU